jgi:chloride channel 7
MNGMMNGRGDQPLLRTVTFNKAPPAAKPYTPGESFLSRLLGPKNPPTQRVSESLDYEPIQNKIFYDRIKESKKKKKLYGCA